MHRALRAKNTAAKRSVPRAGEAAGEPVVQEHGGHFHKGHESVQPTHGSRIASCIAHYVYQIIINQIVRKEKQRHPQHQKAEAAVFPDKFRQG